MKCILTERECRSEGLVASLDCWEEIESLICPVPGSNGLGPVRTTFHEPSMASTARSMLFGALPLPIARAGASQEHSPAFGLYARLVRRSEQPNHLYSIFRPLLTSLVCSSSQMELTYHDPTFQALLLPQLLPAAWHLLPPRQPFIAHLRALPGYDLLRGSPL